MSFSDRKTQLLRILEIDVKIKSIQEGKKYRRLKSDLKALEGANRGRGVLFVHSPDNMDELVELRRNSATVGDYITSYKDKLREDSVLLETLTHEKVILEKSLFHIAE